MAIDTAARHRVDYGRRATEFVETRNRRIDKYCGCHYPSYHRTVKAVSGLMMDPTEIGGHCSWHYVCAFSHRGLALSEPRL